MKTKFFVLFSFIVLLLASCKLTSTTSIDARNAFVLGNNQHGVFNVRLKNISRNDVIIHCAPIEGGQHSFETIKPFQTINVTVEKNTALIIDNQSAEQASVELLVKGDIGLSMGYKK